MLDLLVIGVLLALSYFIGHRRGLRQGYELREMDDADAENRQMARHLDKRIRETFTPEEWAATEKRCKAMLGE
jgi:hypothetical protein